MSEIEEGETMSPLILLGACFAAGAFLYAIAYDPAKAAAQRACAAWRERQAWKRYQDYLYRRNGRL